MREGNMRRSLMMVIALLFACGAVVAGCGGSDGGTDGGGSDTEMFPTGKEIPAEPVELTMWWWGEQEAKGATGWLKETIKMYQEEHPNVTIKPTLQTTDGLVPAFQTAAKAGRGPDIQYFWGGIWGLENAFDGTIRAVSDYIPEEELSHYLNADENSFDGKIWTAPWYVQPSFPVLYRRSVFKDAGVEIPETWDDLLGACKELSSKGVIPMSLGVKDGFLGGWLYSMLGVQNVEVSDVLDAVAGEQSFAESPNGDWWKALQTMRDSDCFNDDVTSLQLYQAQQKWANGDAAMTIVAGSDVRKFSDEVGADDVKAGVLPPWGDGKFAGKLGSTSQTLGITKTSQYPQVAASFIQFMHQPERMNAFFEATGAIPADDRFDASLIEVPVVKSVYDQILDGAPYLENFIPTQLDSDAIFKGVQLVMGDNQDAAAAADNTEKVAARIRTSDPDLTANFAEWAKTR